MGDFLDIATGGGLGLVGDAIGMIGQNAREKRAVRNQKQLNAHGQKLGMKTWEQTNYGPQMEQMKKAGLNPALMYGQGGAGGGTVASASGGSAPAPQPMEIGNKVAEGAMAASQIELNKSATEKNYADARDKGDNPGSVGASVVESNLAGALDKRASAELKGIESYIMGNTKDLQVEEVERRVDNMISVGKLTEQQAEESRKKVVLMGVEGILKSAQIGKTDRETRAIGEQLVVEGAKVAAMLQQIGVGNAANKLRGIEGKSEVTKMGIDMLKFAMQNKLDWQSLTQKQMGDLMQMMSILGIGGAAKEIIKAPAKVIKGFGG